MISCATSRERSSSSPSSHRASRAWRKRRGADTRRSGESPGMLGGVVSTLRRALVATACLAVPGTASALPWWVTDPTVAADVETELHRLWPDAPVEVTLVAVLPTEGEGLAYDGTALLLRRGDEPPLRQEA